MTIEIHNPELEAILQQRLAAGNFASVEDMLLETLRTTQQPANGRQEELRDRARNAAARIRELRKGVILDRPKGMSIREYAHIGHRY
jgi:hypothetical protein